MAAHRRPVNDVHSLADEQSADQDEQDAESAEGSAHHYVCLRYRLSVVLRPLFDNDEDYKRGDEALSAMPAGDTPGKRTSVTKYDVAVRMSD